MSEENKHDAATPDAPGADAQAGQTASAEVDAYADVAAEGDAMAREDGILDADESNSGAGTADDAEQTTSAQIEDLEAQLADANDRALRAQAEAQNAKRRAEQDVEKARKFALERFASALLPVADNLQRAKEAAAAAGEPAAAIAEGVELTLKSFADVLEKNGIREIDPVGEPFDPQLHQAMSMVENPDAEPNTVLDVMQKGYELNGRLMRPAMVLVSKAP